MLDDDEIISLYFQRSEDAITETDKKYSGYCRSIAYNILYSREEAEECVNDTYLNAWNAIPPQRPNKLSAFLGKITRNIALNRYEKNNAAKRGAGQTELALSELAECADMQADVELEDNRRLIAETLKEYLEKKDKQKRIVFMQRYWYLMPVKEIAEKNGMKENQVKSVLFRMRAELKKILQEKELY